MNNIFIFLITLAAVIISACYGSQTSAVRVNDEVFLNKNNNPENQPTAPLNINQADENSQPADDLKKVEPKTQLIWVGEVSDDDLKTNNDKIQIENYGMLTKSPLDKMGVEIRVDVLNCGGYLFSATASKYKIEVVQEERWKLGIISETIAPDAIEKIKQCNYMPREKDDASFFSETWAVAPQDDKRQSIKTRIDARKVFASLPRQTKIWLDQKIIENPEDCCERKNKGVVSVSEQDTWVDFDGDGEIDWLRVVGIDKENLKGKGQNFTATRIFERKKGIWKEIKMPEEKD